VLIGSIRRECLDHVIAFSEASSATDLALVLSLLRSFAPSSFAGQRHSARAHRQPAELGPVIERAEVGGLHHRYERSAA
jgi:hypothetical protein